MRTGHPAVLRWVVVSALTLAACAPSGLAFEADHRVEIVEPDDREKVELPVRLRWKTNGLERGADGSPYFAVFIDRAPIRPKQSLRALADDSCNRSPGCPDLEYFRDRYVFVTDKTSLNLDVLPQKDQSQRTSARNRHEATIVLIDADGHRMGEAAYRVEFTVEDER